MCPVGLSHGILGIRSYRREITTLSAQSSACCLKSSDFFGIQLPHLRLSTPIVNALRRRGLSQSAGSAQNTAARIMLLGLLEIERTRIAASSALAIAGARGGLPSAVDASLSPPRHRALTSKALTKHRAAHPLTHARDLISRETANVPQHQ